MSEFDVVIMGGGLAGLTLARQLHLEVPAARVAVVERTRRPLPEGTHKIGEATVEVGSHYFEHTLQLARYLRKAHLLKNGLRFFPGGGKTHALEDRLEIGPPELPRVASFQIDRGRFENDLRTFCEEDGVTLIEGTRVTELSFGEPHVVTLEDGRVLRGRWVIDATGRRRMIARQLELETSTGHVAHAAWVRVQGRLDVDHLVPKSDERWHRRDLDKIRWLSTSHLMGEGYWVWMIPLSCGMTSVGIVVHGDTFDFDSLNTLERAKAWLAEHEPVLARGLEAHEVNDFHAYKDYSYSSSRMYSADRWALVGEAALFIDPFYSPGSDFVGLTNVYAAEMIRADLAGEDFGALAEHFDLWMSKLAELFTATYIQATKIYGMPRLMSTKLYWDNTNYWSFLSRYFFQEFWRLPLEEQQKLHPVAERFASLNLRAQELFARWADRFEGLDLPERRHVLLPAIPSRLATLYLDLQREMSTEEAFAYLHEKADEAEELLTDVLLRAITELGPEAGAELVDEVGARSWPLAGLEARVNAEKGGRRGRRKRLSKLARDVERTLGPPRTPHGSLLEVAQAVFGEIPDAAE